MIRKQHQVDIKILQDKIKFW